MRHPSPVPALLTDPTHPSLARALRSLAEMKRRALLVTGDPVRAGLEVIESEIPWAGIVEHEDRNRSNMFLSTGLVDKLTQEELIAVMGHEWAHVAEKLGWGEWALKGAALIGSVGFHLTVVSLLMNTSAAGLALGVLCLLMTLGFMALCLGLEGHASRAQELTCDRFAARLVGARSMVSTLRRVDGVMRRHHGLPAVKPPAMPLSLRSGWRRLRMWHARSHPAVEDRVMHISRYRHRLLRA